MQSFKPILAEQKTIKSENKDQSQSLMDLFHHHFNFPLDERLKAYLYSNDATESDYLIEQLIMHFFQQFELAAPAEPQGEMTWKERITSIIPFAHKLGLAPASRSHNEEKMQAIRGKFASLAPIIQQLDENKLPNQERIDPFKRSLILLCAHLIDGVGVKRDIMKAVRFFTETMDDINNKKKLALVLVTSVLMDKDSVMKILGIVGDSLTDEDWQRVGWQVCSLMMSTEISADEQSNALNELEKLEVLKHHPLAKVVLSTYYECQCNKTPCEEKNSYKQRQYLEDAVKLGSLDALKGLGELHIKLADCSPDDLIKGYRYLFAAANLKDKAAIEELSLWQSNHYQQLKPRVAFDLFFEQISENSTAAVREQAYENALLYFEKHTKLAQYEDKFSLNLMGYYLAMNFIEHDCIESALTLFLKLDSQLLSGAQNFDAGFFIYNHLGDFALARPFLCKAAADHDKDAIRFLEKLHPEALDMKDEMKVQKINDIKLVTQFSFFQRGLLNQMSAPEKAALKVADLIDEYMQEPAAPVNQGMLARFKKSIRMPF